MHGHIRNCFVVLVIGIDIPITDTDTGFKCLIQYRHQCNTSFRHWCVYCSFHGLTGGSSLKWLTLKHVLGAALLRHTLIDHCSHVSFCSPRYAQIRNSTLDFSTADYKKTTRLQWSMLDWWQTQCYSDSLLPLEVQSGITKWARASWLACQLQ